MLSMFASNELSVGAMKRIYELDSNLVDILYGFYQDDLRVKDLILLSLIFTGA